MENGECDTVASTFLHHDKRNNSGEPDESLQKEANRKSGVEVAAATRVGGLSSLQMEPVIKDGQPSRHLDHTHIPVAKVATCFDIDDLFSSEPEEYYRMFASEQNTVSGLAGGAITSVSTHSTISTLHSPKKTESIHQPPLFTKPRQKPSPRASPMQRIPRTNDTAEEHDTIASLPQIQTQERHSRTSTMSSMVSAISFQGLGAIYIQPSKELSTMQSISNLKAKLQDMKTLGKTWTRPESHNGIPTASGSPRSIASNPRHHRIHEAHTRLNQALYSPSPPANRINTQNWIGPSEWNEPSCTVEGPKEWIEDFLNRKEEADRAESNMEMQEKNKGFLGHSKSLHRLKSKLSKTRVVEESSTETREEDGQLSGLATPPQPRRSISLRRSISIRTLCPASFRPSHDRFQKSPQSHHQCLRIRCLPAPSPGTLVTDVLAEGSNNAKGLASKISESLKESFMCLGRKVSFRK